MWTEEQGVRIKIDRSAELLGTGASRIATACPSRYIMIDDGSTANGRDDVRVGELAVRLIDALQSVDATDQS